MKALQILDIKHFTSNLFVGDTFDDFWVTDVSIQTSNHFQIDGYLNPDFFSEEELEVINERHYSLWSELKPFCFSLIKGNKPPISFKIVLRLSEENAQKLINDSGLPVSINDVNAFFLNIVYKNSMIACITGTSLSFFTLDKSIEDLWDEFIKKFLKDSNILFE